MTRFTPNGGSLVYSTYLGARDLDRAWALDLTDSGEAVLTGMTNGRFPTTTSPYDRTHDSGWDMFVSQLNAVGSTLSYSSCIGGSADDVGYGIAAETSTRICVTGSSFSANYPTPSANDATLDGPEDAVVTKLQF